MAIHRVLIERDEDVDLVLHITDGGVARANSEESVPAADDRLVGVVSVEVQAAPRKDAGENIPGRGDALAVLAPDANCEIDFCRSCHLCWRGSVLCREALGKRKPRQILVIQSGPSSGVANQ